MGIRMPLAALMAISLPLAAVYLMGKFRKMRSTVRCGISKNMENMVIIVTGGTSGIGRAVVVECFRRGATVVLGCRDLEAGSQVVDEIRCSTEPGTTILTTLPVVLPLDLACLQSVRQFVGLFFNRFNRLDVLVNNAAYLGPKETTSDGCDYCFQVNFLSHFYLSRLIIRQLVSLNTLSSVHPMRVVNVTSDSYVIGDMDFESAMIVDSSCYAIYRAYAISKLAMILFTKQLMSNFSTVGVKAVAVHPGAVRTGLTRRWPGLFGCLLRLFSKLFFRSPKEGAQSIIHCIATDDIDAIEGMLIVECAPAEIKSMACLKEHSERLWALAEKFCKLN